MNYRTALLRLALAILIIILAQFGLDKFAIDEMHGELATRQEFLSGIKLQNAELERVKSNLSQLEKELEEANLRYSALRPLMPTEADLPQIFKYIGDRAAARNVRLEFFSRKNETVNAKTSIVELPIQAEIFGDFYTLTRYLQDLSRFERILRVVSVRMVQEKNQLVATKPDESAQDDAAQNPYRPGREPIATTHATITFVAYLVNEELKTEISQR